MSKKGLFQIQRDTTTKCNVSAWNRGKTDVENIIRQPTNLNMGYLLDHSIE